MADYPPTPPASPPPPAYPTYAPPPSRQRRLMRSTRERMWAGVAGGMAEYFDIDPALVRLLWIAATIVSGGLAVPAYILLWILLPRDERRTTAGPAWHEWGGAGATDAPPPPPASGPTTPPQESTEPWWQSEHYFERPRNHRHHPRSTGIVLVALGVLLLAANAGVFSWIDWRHMWPLIFIGLGILLLARRAGGGGWDR